MQWTRVPPRWCAAGVIAVAAALGAGVAMAEDQGRGTADDKMAEPIGGTPDAETITRIRTEAWMLERRIEVEQLRAELRALRREERAAEEAAAQADADEREAVDEVMPPSDNPQQAWVMTRYSRYGDQRRATIASRYGERVVEPGDRIGAWTVTEVGPKGVMIAAEAGDPRRIPYRDQWLPVMDPGSGAMRNGPRLLR